MTHVLTRRLFSQEKKVQQENKHLLCRAPRLHTAFNNSHLVEMRMVEHMISVNVAPRDLDAHVSMRVEAVNNSHRLVVLGVDLTRNVLDLHLCLPVRRNLQLGGLAGDHLYEQCIP